MVRKTNIVNCEECGKRFDNDYRTRKWSKLGCSRLCARALREKRNVIVAKQRRQKRREEHKCIYCGDDVKTKITYHQCCEKHHKQNIETKKLRDKK